MSESRALRPSALVCLALAAVAAAGCRPSDRPEPPAVERDVALIDDEVEFTHPFVPGHRTTMDGRIAIRVQGGPAGTPDIRYALSFFLFAPEKIDEPILGGPPGARILADPKPTNVFFPPAVGAKRTGHHAICDPTTPFPRPGERTNPYACGPDGAHDCYDITIVSTTQIEGGAQLWGTDAHIEVASPKTTEARIASAELGEPVMGRFLPNSSEWTEPAVTRDGRLLTGRYGKSLQTWTHPGTGEQFRRPYDLMYAQLPDDAEPCDVTGWTDFHPMSYAPHDPRMVGRYGLAAYPFRDSEGNEIAVGEDLGFTYPWVDREGANVFMTGVPTRLADIPASEHPRRCVRSGCNILGTTSGFQKGILVAGLWTHGKMVHLDALVNNTDWPVGVSPITHQMVTLYRDADGRDVEVRVGSGRFVDALRYVGGPFPDGYTDNANVVDSIQNLLNHRPQLMPVTPRDVVWIMSTGVATDEIVFDDYVDPNAFILSDMQGSITPASGEPHYWNGLVHRDSRQGYVDEVHVQNAATSPGWKVPAYGLLEAGTARIEPVALGGIKGKGLWLDGGDVVRYAIPAQTRAIEERDAYLSVFFDPRAAPDAEMVLALFPDGTEIRVVGHSFVRYLVDGELVHQVPLPKLDASAPATRWTHIGLELTDGYRSVQLVHEGFALDRFESERPLFVPVEGELLVGGDGSGAGGFRGWLDELKLFLHDVNPEVACNHAHGTLIDVGSSAGWPQVAARYPNWAHERVAAIVGDAADTRYACYHDYSGDYVAHGANLPAGSRSVREAINFPEGPIRAGMERPDSSANPFCLTCHHPGGQGGLSLAALERRPGVIAEHDRRRQPMQGQRRVFGNIPGGWIAPGPGTGSPAEALVAPPEGLLLDPWVLPGPGTTADERSAGAPRPIHRH